MGSIKNELIHKLKNNKFKINYKDSGLKIREYRDCIEVSITRYGSHLEEYISLNNTSLKEIDNKFMNVGMKEDINNIKNFWENIHFKSVKDIRDYLANYYK